MRLVDYNTSGMPFPHSPLLPRVSRTGRDTATNRLPSTLMSLNPTLQVRSLCWRGTTKLWQRSLLHTENGAQSLLLPLPPPIGGKDWDMPMEDCLLILCQRPGYMAIKASLTRRNYVLETVKKVELWSPNFTTLPGSRIKNMLKYELCYQPIWT